VSGPTSGRVEGDHSEHAQTRIQLTRRRARFCSDLQNLHVPCPSVSDDLFIMRSKLHTVTPCSRDQKTVGGISVTFTRQVGPQWHFAPKGGSELIIDVTGAHSTPGCVTGTRSEPRKTKAARGRPYNNTLGRLSSTAKGTSTHQGFHGHISAPDSSNLTSMADRLQCSGCAASTATSALGSTCNLGLTPSAHMTHRSTASKSIFVAFTLT
jgi:hypothetical protein